MTADTITRGMITALVFLARPSLAFRLVRLWWHHGRIMTISQMEREIRLEQLTPRGPYSW